MDNENIEKIISLTHKVYYKGHHLTRTFKPIGKKSSLSSHYSVDPYIILVFVHEHKYTSFERGSYL